MPELYTILDVSRTRVGASDCWQIRQKRPDGAHHLTIFPTSTLEWRAAEYGIDHTSETGLAQIIDMVLHEPFLQDPLQFRDQDPAAARGMTAASTQAVHGLELGDEAPVTLFNAPSREHARRAHQLRIEHTKATRVQVVTTAPALTTKPGVRAAQAQTPDPLRRLRAEHGITEEGLSAKQSHVEQVRRDLSAQLAEATGTSGEPMIVPQTPSSGMWDLSLARRDEAHRQSTGEHPA